MNRRYISGITALSLAFSALSGIPHADLSLIHAALTEDDIHFSGDTDHFKYDLLVQSGIAKYDYDTELKGILVNAFVNTETDEKPAEKFKSFKDIMSGAFTAEGTVNSKFTEAEGRFTADNFEIVKSEDDIAMNSNLAVVSDSGSSEDDEVTSYRYVLSPETKRIIEFANENNLKFDAGTLIDIRKFPVSFFKDSEGNELSREAFESRLETLIKSGFEELSSAKLDTFDIYCDGYMMYFRPSSDIYWESIYGDESYIDVIFRLCRKYAPEGCRINYRMPDYYFHSENVTDLSEDRACLNQILIPIAERLVKEKLADGVSFGFDVPSFSISKSNNNAMYKEGYKYAIETLIEKGISVRIADIMYMYSRDFTLNQIYVDLFAFYAAHKDGISDLVINTLTRDVLYTEDFKPQDIMTTIEHAVNNSDNILLGDADGNGVLTSADIVTLKSHLTGVSSAGEISAACDMDRDGRITVADLILLKSWLMC